MNRVGKQYQMIEIVLQGKEPVENAVEVNVKAEFIHDGKTFILPGFYAGNKTYIIRFLPEEAGTYTYKISGEVVEEGIIRIDTQEPNAHGIVRTKDMGFAFADGMEYKPFGTTVYALAHQETDVIRQTMETLKDAPFNKIRICLFPKSYQYNENEPLYYPFEKDEEGNWDVKHPCYSFWNAFESCLKQLQQLGIQVDLILFHPYDRWGFSDMPQEDNYTYLEYLLQRFAAFPNVWWSLANEYDLTLRENEQWKELESFVAEHDPYHHLLSCHNAILFWDASRENISHVSLQTKHVNRVDKWKKQYQKPVIIDECGYEGNLSEFWGCISGNEMVRRFWRIMSIGGYCTHGETFIDETGKDVIWWAKGGRLIGESSARIAFLRKIFESFSGTLQALPIHPMASMADLPKEQIETALQSVPKEYQMFVKRFAGLEDEIDDYVEGEQLYQGHVGDDVYLYYYELRTCKRDILNLPAEKTYRMELIDTWNMTKEVIGEHVSGRTEIELPGREDMAILAIAEN